MHADRVSVAAYRLGHSMIRNAYQWNRVFSSDGLAGLVPLLSLFFRFPEVSGDLGGEATLPSDWIVDWPVESTTSARARRRPPSATNFTRQIDTNLAAGLQSLPEFANVEEEHLKGSWLFATCSADGSLAFQPDKMLRPGSVRGCLRLLTSPRARTRPLCWLKASIPARRYGSMFSKRQK